MRARRSWIAPCLPRCLVHSASTSARRIGRLRAGLDADLLLVGGDSTTDITAIRDVRIVVSRGRGVHPSLAA